jgi:hypothetical protein|tara:strand:- start:7461 stop:7637 length:177 start_codon:yes stop_codon:yes gene_type:complete
MPKGKGTYGSKPGRPRTPGTKKGPMPITEAQRKRLIGKNKISAKKRKKETIARMGPRK